MLIKLPYPSADKVPCPPELERAFKTAFPDYRGKKFKLAVSEHVCCADTYWDGGSRSQYVFVNLADGRQMELPDLISGGFAPHARQAMDALRSVDLKAGMAVIRHSIFCGKDAGLTLTLHPDNVGKLLVSAVQ